MKERWVSEPFSFSNSNKNHFYLSSWKKEWAQWSRAVLVFRSFEWVRGGCGRNAPRKRANEDKKNSPNSKRAPFVFADSNAEWIYEWSLRRRWEKTNKRRTKGLPPRGKSINSFIFCWPAARHQKDELSWMEGLPCSSSAKKTFFICGKRELRGKRNKQTQFHFLHSLKRMEWNEFGFFSINQLYRSKEQFHQSTFL